MTYGAGLDALRRVDHLSGSTQTLILPHSYRIVSATMGLDGFRTEGGLAANFQQKQRTGRVSRRRTSEAGRAHAGRLIFCLQKTARTASPWRRPFPTHGPALMRGRAADLGSRFLPVLWQARGCFRDR